MIELLFISVLTSSIFMLITFLGLSKYRPYVWGYIFAFPVLYGINYFGMTILKKRDEMLLLKISIVNLFDFAILIFVSGILVYTLVNVIKFLYKIFTT